ncbi:MAG: type II toxin-antitoxin system RelE/ParE family toxin [Chloroflexi bacterium]|nr:type II toxin-antitoxin system RelE/ParE family toxin [Chloroflexota bacterium]
MARFRWSAAARHQLDALLDWHERQRGPEQAARLAADIRQAVRRAAARPELYPWVGSIHAELSSLPRSIRRVLTRPSHHAIYYRYDAADGWISILQIRGSRQLPPSADELI